MHPSSTGPGQPELLPELGPDPLLPELIGDELTADDSSPEPLDSADDSPPDAELPIPDGHDDSDPDEAGIAGLDDNVLPDPSDPPLVWLLSALTLDVALVADSSEPPELTADPELTPLEACDEPDPAEALLEDTSST